MSAVVDLTADDDIGVAKRPIECIVSDDDDDITPAIKIKKRPRYLMRLANAEARLKRSGDSDTDDDNDDDVIVLETTPFTTASTKKNDSVAIVKVVNKSPLLQILEVFPDVQTEHVQQLLTTHHQHTATVLQVLAESSYPKATPQKKGATINTAATGIVIAHRNEGQLQWSHDFSSPSAFEPTPAYVREAKQLLLQDFRFLTSRTIDIHLKAANNHYTVCYERISKAIMLQENKKTKDEEVELQQYDRWQLAFVTSLGRKQLLALMALTNTAKSGLKKQEILIKKRRKVCKIVLHDILLKEELDCHRMKQAEWKTRMESIKQRQIDRRKAEENQSTVECNCCYSGVSPEELVNCAEGHLFCTDCLKAFGETKIFSDGNFGTHPHTKEAATDLLCMSGCGANYALSCLEKALSKQVMVKYHAMHFQAAIAKVEMDDLCSCPKCNYQAVLPSTEMIFRCPVGDCGFESCRKCGEEPHIPLKCEEVEKKHETKGRLRVEEAISEAKIRTCPKCSKKFVKESGCNKMTCACGVHICYVCRVVIPNSVGYKHFCQKAHCTHATCGGCVLHSNAEEDDKQAMREAGERAAKEVRGDAGEGEVDVNVDSILHETAIAPPVAAVRNPNAAVAHVQANHRAALVAFQVAAEARAIRLTRGYRRRR